MTHARTLLAALVAVLLFAAIGSAQVAPPATLDGSVPLEIVRYDARWWAVLLLDAEGRLHVGWIDTAAEKPLDGQGPQVVVGTPYGRLFSANVQYDLGTLTPPEPPTPWDGGPSSFVFNAVQWPPFRWVPPPPPAR